MFLLSNHKSFLMYFVQPKEIEIVEEVRLLDSLQPGSHMSFSNSNVNA